MTDQVQKQLARVIVDYWREDGTIKADIDSNDQDRIRDAINSHGSFHFGDAEINIFPATQAGINAAINKREDGEIAYVMPAAPTNIGSLNYGKALHQAETAGRYTTCGI